MTFSHSLHLHHQPCWHSSQRLRTAFCTGPPQRQAVHQKRTTLDHPRGLLNRIFGGEEAEPHGGPELVPLDSDSGGGLGGTSEDLFGPLAILLVGFTQYEVDAVRRFMIDMDGDVVKIIACTGKLLASSLEEALASPATIYEPLPIGTHRAVILSGMSAAEVQEVVAAYSDSGLPGAFWAAAVPANYDRQVGTLLADIHGDHSVMIQREQDAALRRTQGRP